MLITTQKKKKMYIIILGGRRKTHDIDDAKLPKLLWGTPSISSANIRS